VSNIGDAVKCYGRALRFPQDKHLYLAEMKLALGDVIMQCRLIEEEKTNGPSTVYSGCETTTEKCLAMIAYHGARVINELIGKQKTYITQETNDILRSINQLCTLMDLDFDEIEHLGFLHTIERFEQFERDDWK